MSAQPEPAQIGGETVDLAKGRFESAPTVRPLALAPGTAPRSWLLDFRRKALLVDLSAAVVVVVLASSFRFGDKLPGDASCSA